MSADIAELRARIAALHAKAPAGPAAPARPDVEPLGAGRWVPPEPAEGQPRYVSGHLHDPTDMERVFPEQRCRACGQEWVLLGVGDGAEEKRQPKLYARSYRGEWPRVRFGWSRSQAQAST